MAKMKNLRNHGAHRSTHIGDEGAMRECAHPPCRTKTTAQFCVVHALMVGTFNKIDGNHYENKVPAQRMLNR